MSTPDLRPRVSPKIAALAVSALVGVTALAATSTNSFATQGAAETFSVTSLERLPQEPIPDPLPDTPDPSGPANPLPTTSRPAPTTSRPAPTTSRPAPTTSRPAPKPTTDLPTASPSKTTLPLPTVAPTASSSATAVPPTTRPVPTLTTRPVPTTSRPAPTTSRPAPTGTTRPPAQGKPPVQTPGGYVDIIKGGQFFDPGYGIRSKNGNYVFGLWNGGQVALYSYITKKHIWTASNVPAGGVKLILQKNGDLQVLNNAGKMLWHTDTAADIAPGEEVQLFMSQNGDVQLWHGSDMVWHTDTGQK